jgi:hypothetical protein
MIASVSRMDMGKIKADANELAISTGVGVKMLPV